MIGLLGGTFDPPHLGHLVLADEARAALNLERVLWIVTGEPPHKPDRAITPVEHRLGMVQKAIEDVPEFEISRVEVDRPPPHYASDTLSDLKSSRQGESFSYLMGKDSLRDLPNWHEPQRLVDELDSIAVLNRQDVELDLNSIERALPGISQKVRLLEVPVIGVSSRQIRRRVSEGRPIRFLVGSKIAEYIRQHELYR